MFVFFYSMCMCVSVCKYLHIGVGLWWPGEGLESLSHKYRWCELPDRGCGTWTQAP